MKRYIYFFFLATTFVFAEKNTRLKAEINEVKGKVKIKISKDYKEVFEYKVQDGDTLGKISKKFNVSILEIIKNNKIIVNKDLIYTGDTLIIKR